MSEPVIMEAGHEEAALRCRTLIRRHSRSFALAGALLERRQRRDAFALYAWCRLADDAVDLVAPDQAPLALTDLRQELDVVYAGGCTTDPVLKEFQRVVHDRSIARTYPQQLLEGLAMDAAGARYRTVDELMLYCFRVAGTVGLMMCHVLGIKSERALVHAAELGIAMQLTNICRDVREDWQRGRLYLPTGLCAAAGAPIGAIAGSEPPGVTRSAMGASVAALLKIADDLYVSARAGFGELGWRAALSVQAASLIYSAIGQRLMRRHFDAWRGRAVVPLQSKVILLGRAFLSTLGQIPRRLRDQRQVALPRTVARFCDVVVYG